MDFENTDSGSSKTYPCEAGSLKVNGYVVLKNRPCKISELVTSKVGKHGHAKTRIVGIDIFTDKKYEDIFPATHNVEVPFVTRNEYTVITIDVEGYLSLLLSNGLTREDLKAESSLGNEIREALASDKELSAVSLAAMGEEHILSIKLVQK